MCVDDCTVGNGDLTLIHLFETMQMLYFSLLYVENLKLAAHIQMRQY